MKELLVKLTRCNVNICFKSGDKLCDVCIEAIIGNTMVANYDGRITLIEIPHIAYVSTEKGIMEVMEMVLKNQKNDEKQEKKEEEK